MQFKVETIQNVLKILHEEVIPAQGCTEPIALAFTAAKAREVMPLEDIKRVVIRVSGNIIKNVKSVVVPNSGGMVGIEVSAVMGLLFGDASKDLMVISDITPKQMEEVREFLNNYEIKVIHEDTPIKLYIMIELHNDNHCSSVEIKHLHTNITQIKRDKETLLQQACNDKCFNTSQTDREILSIKLIYELAQVIDIEKIEPLMSKVITLNSNIANEGLSGNYGVNIGKL